MLAGLSLISFEVYWTDNRRAVEVALEPKDGKVVHPVTAKEMMSVLNLMSSSPVAMFLKQCSLQQKMMLAAVVRCVRREGIPEIPWRAVRFHSL